MPKGRAIIVWVAAGLGIMLALGFLRLGWSEEGVRSAVRSTAQVAVVCFVLAFSASSLRVLLRSPSSAWMLANRRHLGLSFAFAHTVHLLALIALALFFPEPFMSELNAVTLVGGGLAYVFLFALAITSNDASVARLGRRRWRLLHLVGSYYIWLIFFQSYAPRALAEPFYVPFGLLLLAAPSLRIARWARDRKRTRPAAAVGAAALCMILGVAGPPDAWAGEADVMIAEAQCDDAGLCHIEATIKHADIGQSHYADRFEVLDEQGNVIATRVLAHPHVHEQPFTRALSAAEIPEGIDVVVIRAHDSKHGDGGRQVRLPLERPGRTRSVKEPAAADAGKSK
jgi:DMSO/TMAO reductase YedYZ heme-binding membrane subunit